MARKRYNIIGLGGTFDHFHKGHESFLLSAADLAEFVIVGVTHEKLTQHKKHSQLIQPYFKRAQAVHKFYTQHHIPHTIVTLNDPYGPPIEPESQIEALAVTDATVTGAEKINTIRDGLGLPELPIHVHHLLTDNTGTVLSAERIRNGEINRQGEVYGQLFQSDFKLSSTHRAFFQKLQGKLVNQPSKPMGQVIVVGDATFERFISFGWPLDLAVFDGQTQRQPVEKLSAPTHTLENPAGIITKELFAWLQKYFQKTYSEPQLLQIKGEEDLATVAAVLAAPLETTIYFGQPNQGMVELQVTEKRKNLFYQALTQ